MLTRNVLYYGKTEPLVEQVPLRAGPLAMVFEGGDVRWICLGQHELVRRIYVAVRDANWGTVTNRLSNVTIARQTDRFEIRYDVENREGQIDFRWSARIRGDENGGLTFSMRGEARTSFLKNRIGFCLLHPLSAAGRPCVLEKVDGTCEEAAFPALVAPHQPFLDFRGISYEIQPGLRLRLVFEGDVFETEDQRNWTDASLKTYCTPLRLPFPVEIPAGTAVEQAVTLKLSGGAFAPASIVGTKEADRICFSFTGPSRPLPQIGLGSANHGIGLGRREIARLRSLNLSHLRVDLDLCDQECGRSLERSVEETKALGVSLEAALILSEAAADELEMLLSELKRLQAPVARWLVFHRWEKSTSARWVRLVRDRLSGFNPSALVICGTNAYFAELNRGRPDPEFCDGGCFSVNPQVHAFDNASLVESLAAQADTVVSAAGFLPGRPVFVTPVTLRPRFNPNATSEEPSPRPDELPPQVDPRQMSLFGAGWTAGSIKYLAEAGAAGVTYYETTGWRGVMETEQGAPSPELFPSIPGTVFPLFHVLRYVGEFRGGEVMATRSEAPLVLDGFALRRGRRLRVVLANLTPASLAARLELPGAERQAQISVLDETNAESAMRDPEAYHESPGSVLDVTDGRLDLDFKPYGLVRIDL